MRRATRGRMGVVLTLAMALPLSAPIQGQELRPAALSATGATAHVSSVLSPDLRSHRDDAMARLRPESHGPHRSGALPFVTDESDPPRYRSKYILIGGLAGAVLGAGGAGIFLAQNCDDCFFAGQFVIASVLGGAIVGGVAGSSLFDWRRSRATRERESGARPPDLY